MSILISQATVVTGDGDGRIFEPGAVMVEGGRIVDVGPSDELEARHANPDRRIDGRGKLVAPGLISAHTHLGYTVFRGQSEDVGLKCVTGQYNPMAEILTREERKALGALTFVELLKSGCTTIVDIEEDADVLAPFAEDLGVRAVMGVMVQDIPAGEILSGSYRADPAMGARLNEQAIRFAEEWHGAADGRISALMAPNLTISSSPGQLEALRAAADRLGCRITIHLGWGPLENRVIQRLHGMNSLPYARQHGMLGPDVIATHCYVIDDADIDLLAETGTHIAHCPLMNAFRGHIAPIAELRARGVNVGLGIDNYFADFFEVLRAAVTVARIRARDATAVVAGDALHMATMGGARSLGMADTVGSLEAGKKADLMILDTRRTGLAPMLNPVPALVYHASSHHVDAVMVDGRMLVENGQVLPVDEGAIVEAASRAATAAWGRFIERYGSTLADEPTAATA
jgi:cytosine/adenosine deaminase-related metal-dependent hydrolase